MVQLVLCRESKMPSLRKTIDKFLDARAAPVPTLYLSADERLALFRNYGDFSLAYSTATQAG